MTFLLSVFDLKAVRKAVDYGFDTFMPKNAIYHSMGPQARNDVYNIEIESIDDPQTSAQVKVGLLLAFSFHWYDTANFYKDIYALSGNTNWSRLPEVIL